MHSSYVSGLMLNQQENTIDPTPHRHEHFSLKGPCVIEHINHMVTVRSCRSSLFSRCYRALYY